jgi:hypothetical protein
MDEKSDILRELSGRKILCAKIDFISKEPGIKGNFLTISIFLNCDHKSRDEEEFFNQFEFGSGSYVGPIDNGIIWLHDGTWMEYDIDDNGRHRWISRKIPEIPKECIS